MSVDIDPDLDGVLGALQQGQADWVLLNYGAASKDTLRLKNYGCNGVEELKVSLRHNHSEAQFGFLRVETKTLLFNVIPETIGGVKRARATVHTTALRNRVSSIIPAVVTLSVSNPNDLTISSVRSKLKLSPVPSLHMPPERSGSKDSAEAVAEAQDSPPVPPKDYPPSPLDPSANGSNRSSGASSYVTGEPFQSYQNSVDMNHHNSLTQPMLARKRTPSPILVPDSIHYQQQPEAQYEPERLAPTNSGEDSSTMLSYLQNGSIPSSPVEAMAASRQKDPETALPVQNLSSVPSVEKQQASPQRYEDNDINDHEEADQSVTAEVLDDVVQNASHPASPLPASNPSSPVFSSHESSNSFSKRQSSSTILYGSQPVAPVPANRSPPSSQTDVYTPPKRSTSLQDGILHRSQSSSIEPRQQRHARGPSASSSVGVSPTGDQYCESITTSITSATGESSSAPFTPSSSQRKPQDAAIEAEQKRQAAWEADAPRRRTLATEDQIRLERTEVERRAAAERQRRELQWRDNIELQETMLSEEAERKEREEAERQEREAAAEKERQERAEQAQKEAEERKRKVAEDKALRQQQVREQLDKLRLEGDKVMLDGYVSAQAPNSTLWRRRWFELSNGQLRLFKSPEETSKPVRTLALAGQGPIKIEDAFEETSVDHSFSLQWFDEDPSLFFCDEEADKELLTQALKVAASS